MLMGTFPERQTTNIDVAMTARSCLSCFDNDETNAKTPCFDESHQNTKPSDTNAAIQLSVVEGRTTREHLDHSTIQFPRRNIAIINSLVPTHGNFGLDRGIDLMLDRLEWPI